MTEITKNLFYVGVNDTKIDLFEGQFKVPDGMCYNSYILKGEKTAVFDTADANFTDEWLENVSEALGGVKPDYLVVSHMEPDHSANVKRFIEKYPETKIVGNMKTFSMIKQFFGDDFTDNQTVVKDGDTLSLGGYTLTFVFAPMVHWPEVMMTYVPEIKTLFSADAFGKFGTFDKSEDWTEEARRYYIGIVGKYGVQVQNVLKKASALDIERICALHGPVLTDNISEAVELYNKWSSYTPESEGVLVAYTSVYGNTKKAALLCAEKLKENGCKNVEAVDLLRCDIYKAVADAFKYSTLVLATTTYNGDIFPAMRRFITLLTDRGYQKRKIGIIENGTWAPMCDKVIKQMFEKSKEIEFAESTFKIKSALSEDCKAQMDALVKEII